MIETPVLLQLEPNVELTSSELCHQFHELKKTVSILEKKIQKLEEQSLRKELPQLHPEQMGRIMDKER